MTATDEPTALDRFGRRVVPEPPAPEPPAPEPVKPASDDAGDDHDAAARKRAKAAPPKEYPKPVSFYSEEGRRRWAEYQTRPDPPDTPDTPDEEASDGSWQPDDELPGGRRSAARRLSVRGSIDGSIDD